MAAWSISKTALLDLPLEVLTCVCQQLDVRDLVRVAETCKLFRHGDGGMETVELPTKSPVVAALSEQAFSNGEMVPSTRPVGCAESWVGILSRCARQHRCRIAAKPSHTLLLDVTGRLLACGQGDATGHGEAAGAPSAPTPVAAMAGVLVRSVAAGDAHCLALTWDGQIYAWADRNNHGQLGIGDRGNRHSPVPVEGLKEVLSITASNDRSLAVAQSGSVFSLGREPLREVDALRPIFVEGFGEGERVRRVFAGISPSARPGSSSRGAAPVV
jgi:hypothetical protein